jgi:putative hydrolase of HD superfamily
MKPLPAAIASVALTLLPVQSRATCGTNGAARSPAQVVQAQVDAYNAHDVEALAACYANDAGLLYLSGEHPSIRGADAIRSAFGFLARQPKDFHVDILERIVNGPVVIDQERLHACHWASTCPTPSRSTRCATGRSRRCGFRRPSEWDRTGYAQMAPRSVSEAGLAG